MKCSCGATLNRTSLTCASCGKKLTVDAHQSGTPESSRGIDWDAEFEKLASGDIRPAKIEATVTKQSWLKRLFRRR